MAASPDPTMGKSRTRTPDGSTQEDAGMDKLTELWRFLMVRKKFWLIPLLIFLLLLGFLIVFAGGTAVAPFIYTIF